MGFLKNLKKLLPQAPSIAFEALTGNQKGAALTVAQTLLDHGSHEDATRAVAVAVDDHQNDIEALRAEIAELKAKR